MKPLPRRGKARRHNCVRHNRSDHDFTDIGIQVVLVASDTRWIRFPFDSGPPFIFGATVGVDIDLPEDFHLLSWQRLARAIREQLLLKCDTPSTHAFLKRNEVDPARLIDERCSAPSPSNQHLASFFHIRRYFSDWLIRILAAQTHEEPCDTACTEPERPRPASPPDHFEVPPCASCPSPNPYIRACTGGPIYPFPSGRLCQSLRDVYRCALLSRRCRLGSLGCTRPCCNSPASASFKAWVGARDGGPDGVPACHFG